MLGREREVAAAVHLLRWEGRRLLTLTGPGGVGKTRLAIEVAATIAADLEGGAIFVPLEELVETDEVRPAIAAAIHLREGSGMPLHESLVQHLEDRELLLVLDGFEHLMGAASLPAQLLMACPRLKVLVTSRVPLHLRGEQELDVKPLPVPDPNDPIVLQRLAVYPSVSLFVQRAREVKHGFELTPETAPLLAEICRRLDGLPLAIELAAARVKLLSPQALLLRLESALNVLTGGPRDAQPRQQTMRATIVWSYDLLAEDAQTLFRRLAVFSLPFGLEAVGAVCWEAPGSGAAPHDGLGVLVNGSLLTVNQTATGEARYSMLETVREYGLELLGARGEREAVRERLADYCVTLAETAEAELHGANQAHWVARLDREHGILLLVLRWARESAQLVTGFRIASALWRFWYSRGYLSEGRRQLEALLAAAHDLESMPAAVTSKALRGAAVLATNGIWVRSATFRPDGRQLLLAGWDGHTTLWDAALPGGPVKVFARPGRDIPLYAAEGALHLAVTGSLSVDEASVSVPVALAPGKTYTVTLVWKANHLTGGKIHVGAGPGPTVTRAYSRELSGPPAHRRHTAQPPLQPRFPQAPPPAAPAPARRSKW